MKTARSKEPGAAMRRRQVHSCPRVWRPHRGQRGVSCSCVQAALLSSPGHPRVQPGTISLRPVTGAGKGSHGPLPTPKFRSSRARHLPLSFCAPRGGFWAAPQNHVSQGLKKKYSGLQRKPILLKDSDENVLQSHIRVM